ncbi:PKD domain-containing protein [Methanothrix soehngenii]|uniref:PKD domain-containing protein n=1 Tax=Methanothrix soehngenii TaxID=2223 RepID=UPI00300CD170
MAFAFVLGLLCLLGQLARAQTLGPIITIPIEKVRELYRSTNESGTRLTCGVRLYGEWPVYLNYTNRSSYSIFTPGLQSTASPQSSAPRGGRFRFGTYFNGIDTFNFNANCPTEIGNTLPDWYVEVRRRGPSASFTALPFPPEPGRFEFKSTSTDPEGEPVLENWNMGDGSTRDGASLIHRYTQPGNFPVALTVTDTDVLTNRATRIIAVPAPKPIVSIRLLNKHSGNRIEPGEEFTARVTVSVTDDGVGALSNLAFTTTPLLVPGHLHDPRCPAAAQHWRSAARRARLSSTGACAPIPTAPGSLPLSQPACAVRTPSAGRSAPRARRRRGKSRRSSSALSNARSRSC